MSPPRAGLDGRSRVSGGRRAAPAAARARSTPRKRWPARESPASRPPGKTIRAEPPARRWPAIAAPAAPCDSPTFMSIGRAPISMISTTGRPQRSSSARVRGWWRVPATIRPGGDQPRKVEIQPCSRSRSYSVLPSRSWKPAACTTSWMPWTVSTKPAFDSDGTTTGITGELAEASAPATRFCT